MRACLCIGVLLQLKKNENTAKRANNDWDDDNRRAFLLRGYIMRYGAWRRRRRRRETKVFESGRNEPRRKLNGKGREK